MKLPIAILRWHISRVDSIGVNDPDYPQQVCVTVVRGTDYPSDRIKPTSCLKLWRESFLGRQMIPPMEVFSWWDESDDVQKWVSRKLLFDALTHRNMLVKNGIQTGAVRRKEIAEDMVFLQFLYFRKQFERAWEKAAAEGLENLLEIPSARWIDFTRQARKASSKVYGTLVGQQREGEKHDSQ